MRLSLFRLGALFGSVNLSRSRERLVTRSSIHCPRRGVEGATLEAATIAETRVAVATKASCGEARGSFVLSKVNVRVESAIAPMPKKSPSMERPRRMPTTSRRNRVYASTGAAGESCAAIRVRGIRALTVARRRSRRDVIARRADDKLTLM
jgi:hypothetical protein